MPSTVQPVQNELKTRTKRGSSMCVRVSWRQHVCPWEAGGEAISCDTQVYQVLYALAPLNWRIQDAAKDQYPLNCSLAEVYVRAAAIIYRHEVFAGQ